MEKITCVNGKILKWARQTSGKDLDEVFSHFGNDKFLKWEDENDFPTYVQLEKLMRFYRKPILSCFFDETPELKEMKKELRTLPESIKSGFTSEHIKLFDRAEIMQMNLKDLRPEKQQSLLSIYNNDWSKLDDKAKEVRRILNTSLNQQKSIKKSRDVFDWYKDTLFEFGIYVFQEPFEIDDLSGFCIYDNEYPVIFINSRSTETRKLFTLFHELYHLLSMTTGVDFYSQDRIEELDSNNLTRIEFECNEFAGEFLVPFENLKKVIESQPSLDLVKLSKLYSVSKEVIVRKLFDMKEISYESYLDFSKDFREFYKKIVIKKKNSGGPSYYVLKQYKLGHKYIDECFKKYNNSKIDVFDLSRFLGMKVQTTVDFSRSEFNR